MENIVKTNDNWLEYVLKYFKLAKLMDTADCPMFKLIPIHKPFKGIVGFTVSFGKFDGSTKQGWSWRRLTIKSNNKHKTFVLPYSVDYLIGLGTNHEWWKRTTPMFSDNYSKYFIAVSKLYDELAKNLGNLYWKKTKFIPIDNVELYLIDIDLNISSDEVDLANNIAKHISP